MIVRPAAVKPKPQAAGRNGSVDLAGGVNGEAAFFALRLDFPAGFA